MSNHVITGFGLGFCQVGDRGYLVETFYLCQINGGILEIIEEYAYINDS